MGTERVEIWAPRRGSWRWRFVGPDDLILHGNMACETLEEARRNATAAYPGVRIQVFGQPVKPRRRLRSLVRRLVLAVFLAVFLAEVARRLLRR